MPSEAKALPSADIPAARDNGQMPLQDSLTESARADATLPDPATAIGAPQWRPALDDLGEAFYTRLPAVPLPAPHWVATSAATARDLGLSAQWLASESALQLLSGNASPVGSQTLASVYSGHQFGVWAGQLGDGRALLLGQLDTPMGPMEVQLKGSGLTPYSRMGDGRAVLRSSIREFLVSEAMQALGIPTTRALALIGSPLRVRRETMETTAVVTRAAPSFVRFGHFEHFAAAGNHDALRQLADHVIARHYPECRAGAVLGNPYADFLQAVSERTAALVAKWQAIGFCHGVLNTDNMSILGLTIDYGPFQFLDAYIPNHVCNHSDTMGRYAFDRQPNVAYWNLFCLGQALQPLIGAPEKVTQALESYKSVFPRELMRCMRAKLGLPAPLADESVVMDGILRLLADNAVDTTIFWRRLSHAVAAGDFEPVRDLFADRAALDQWLLIYSELLAQTDHALAANLMLKTNPAYVLRNYLAEQAIRQANGGDFSEVHRLQTLLAHPFEERPGDEAYALPPPDWASHLSISCSS